LDFQNNYVERLGIMNNVVKNFEQFLTISLSVLYNYFNSVTKLFSNLYLAKLLNILAKIILSVI